MIFHIGVILELKLELLEVSLVLLYKHIYIQYCQESEVKNKITITNLFNKIK